MSSKLVRAYFNVAYNRVYDLTTARLASYVRLQDECVRILDAQNREKVLLIGVGTGNEILRILAADGTVEITGIDYSDTALKKARKKLAGRNNDVKLVRMDAMSLEFASDVFDCVLCIHVMDFLDDTAKAFREILRVLKKGGRFVVTYPSDREGVGFGLRLFIRDISFMRSSGMSLPAIVGRSLLRVFPGFIYLPLLFRPGRRSYEYDKLLAELGEVVNNDIEIIKDSVYQDYIVIGSK